MEKPIIKDLVAYGNKMKCIASNELQIGPKFILSTFRQCGYDSYSALADITDNSLEQEVGAKNVSVDFEVESRKITAILISDDGCGMNLETLTEALKLGSDTGKNHLTLGFYGSGFKASSLSQGRLLEIYTKTEDGDLLLGVIDLDAVDKGEGVRSLEDIVKIYKIDEDSDKYIWFINKINNTHGTVVKISNLDMLTNRDVYSFSDTLRNDFGEIYNKFISSKLININVNGVAVKQFDLMGSPYTSVLLAEGDIICEGHTIHYKAYYIPNAPDTKDNKKYIDLGNGVVGLNRGLGNEGFYLYRNNRLVGRAVTLGFFGKHSIKNGFRCELFFDGTCDYLFGSTFNKIVGEKPKHALNQTLRDKIQDEISPYWIDAQKRQQRSDKATNEEEDNKNKIIFKSVAETQNMNTLLNVGRDIQKKEDNKNKGVKRGKYKKTGEFKGKKNKKWFGGFEVVSLGETDEIFVTDYRENLAWVLINRDHEFYRKFFSKLSDDLKFVYCWALSCDELAKRETGYYGDNYEEVQFYLDTYLKCLSSKIRASLNLINEPSQMVEDVV